MRKRPASRGRRENSSRLRSPKKRSRDGRKTAFLNVPYDKRFENLYLAFIAGLCGFGLFPRATVELVGSRRRLHRIISLIRSCRYSLHDLSRVQLDRISPRTPRFNMPFELGLAVALSGPRRREHQLFVFEALPYRLNKSLSDLDGTDPYIHNGKAEGVLRALTNAFSRRGKGPTLDDLRRIHRGLRKAAREIRKNWNGPLFEARPFGDLVVSARLLAEERLAASR